MIHITSASPAGAMLVLFFLILNVPHGDTLCPESDFHRLMEETWSQDSRLEEDVSLLPRERLEELREYCNCLEGEQTSSFCRSVFISYHAKPQEIQKHPVKLASSGYKTKKNTKERSYYALLPKEDSKKNLHKFISEISKNLLVNYAVVLVDADDFPSLTSISRLAKTALMNNLRVTVHIAREGGNITRAILQSGNQPAALFVLGSHNKRLVREVSRTKRKLHD